MLKPTYATQDEIPEAVREHYVERDGAFQLELDGATDAAPALKRALDYERAERRKANQERDAVRAKLVELEAAKDAAADKGTPQGDAQAAAFQRRIEALEQTIRAEQQKRAEAEQRLADNKVNDYLRAAATEIGIDPSLVDDVIQLPRVRRPWRLDDDGTPVPFDGDSPLYSLKDPSRPMPATEYLSTQLKDARAYFKPSSGAGVPAGTNGVRASGKVSISAADAQDHQKWLRAKDAARKAGQEAPVIIE